MHVDATVTVGNILTIVTGIVAIVIFFVRQERLHGSNQTRFAVLSNDILHMRTDIAEIKDDMKTSRTIILRATEEFNGRKEDGRR